MARFISRREAARKLGVTSQTISNYLKEGKLNGMRYNGRTLVDSITLNAILNNSIQMTILQDKINLEEKKTTEIINKLIKHQTEIFSVLKTLESVDNEQILSEFIVFMLNRFSYNEKNRVNDYNILYKLFKGKNIIEVSEEDRCGIGYISKLICDVFDASVLSWNDDNILMKTIDDTDLSIRSKNVLKKHGFQHLIDLLKVNDLKEIKGLGKHCITEIENLKKKISLAGACISDSICFNIQGDDGVYRNEHDRFYLNYIWKQCDSISKENEKKLEEYDYLHKNGQIITYIVSDCFGCYKIGKTVNMRDRLMNFYVCNPTIKIEGLIYEDCENELHQICRKRNICGEWFLLTETEVRLILNHRFDLLKESIEY